MCRGADSSVLHFVTRAFNKFDHLFRPFYDTDNFILVIFKNENGNHRHSKIKKSCSNRNGTNQLGYPKSVEQLFTSSALRGARYDNSSYFSFPTRTSSSIRTAIPHHFFSQRLSRVCKLVPILSVNFLSDWHWPPLRPGK